MKITTNRRITISRGSHGNFSDETARDVLKGLTAEQKSIPSKYFYDATGSRLFERICILPEYYQTRTELSILRQNAGRIMEGFREGDLVELGSGANWKIRTLLDVACLSRPSGIRYVPVDVCADSVMESSSQLVGTYAKLTVHGVIADITADRDALTDGRQRLITFFGSTIGNFDREERKAFLTGIARSMGSDDRMLLGVDLLKPVPFIERAYNDHQGVTAAFNKNMLSVMNRELRADFNPNYFVHHAFFNPVEERIEMHLKATRRLSVRAESIDLGVEMEKGETILTEVSCKFSIEGLHKETAEAGLRIKRTFSDARGWFAVLELVRAAEAAP